MSHQSFTLLEAEGVINQPNPIAQVRQCAYQVVNKLKRDKTLA